jgi:hypothetical protein
MTIHDYEAAGDDFDRKGSDEFDRPERLGPCGCVDYHMADCPIRTGGAPVDESDWYDDERYY